MPQSLEGHTVHRYDGELNYLHMMMLEMAGLVIDQTRLALEALLEKDLEASRSVVDREHQVDDIEVRIDEELVSVIARRGPVARDLRVIVAFSKAVTDLERIGDEAARIAHIAVSIYDNDSSDPSDFLLRDIQTMGRLVSGMLEKAIAVFDTINAEQADEIVHGASELDVEFQSCLRRLATFMLEDARNVGHVINVTLILKALERIGDHAVNLAEYVIYLVRGEDIRHQTDED